MSPLDQIYNRLLELLEKSKRIITLQNIHGLISWDTETKMPPAGISQRSQQLSTIM